MARNKQAEEVSKIKKEESDTILKWAKAYGIPEDLAIDIAFSESSLDTNNRAEDHGFDGKHYNVEFTDGTKKMLTAEGIKATKKTIKSKKLIPYSSAAGLFMFTNDTWKDAIRNGVIDANASKLDKEANAKAAMWFIANGYLSKWDASKDGGKKWGQYYNNEELTQIPVKATNKSPTVTPIPEQKITTTPTPTPTPQRDNKTIAEGLVKAQLGQTETMQPMPTVNREEKKIKAKENLKMLIENGRTIKPDTWNSMFGDVMPYSDRMVEEEKNNQYNAKVQQKWKKENPAFALVGTALSSLFKPKPVFSAENGNTTPQQNEIENINLNFLQNPQLTQKYGAKTFSFYGNAGHEGNDFRAAKGTPVRGFTGWIVDFAGQGESYYGNKVALRNPKTGEVVEFAHLNDVAVQKGQTIGKDQIIATTGNSGYRPDGKKQEAHLHVNYYTPQDKKGDLVQVAKSADKNFAMTPTFQSVFEDANNKIMGKVVPKVQAQEPMPVSTPKKESNVQESPYLRNEQNPNTPGEYVGKSQGGYQIKQGDTLGNLARQYNTTVADFMRLNKDITNPNTIRTGQQINVPSSVIETNKGDGYTIRSGDTLTTIARNLGTTVNDLVRKNGIQNPNLIRAGTKLKV